MILRHHHELVDGTTTSRALTAELDLIDLPIFLNHGTCLVKFAHEAIGIPVLRAGSQVIVGLLDSVDHIGEVDQPVRAGVALDRVHVAEQQRDGFLTLCVRRSRRAGDQRCVLVDERGRGLAEFVELLVRHAQDLPDDREFSLLCVSGPREFAQFRDVAHAQQQARDRTVWRRPSATSSGRGS